MTQPTPTTLLRDADRYLSALHGSVARHDNLAANLACAGCELRDRIAAVLPTLAEEPAAPAAVVPAPTDRRNRYATAIRSAGDTAYGTQPFYDAITTAAMAVADAEQADLRARANVLSAEITRRAPLLGEYAAQIANLRTMYEVSEARVNDLIEERDQLLEQQTTRGAALREGAAALGRMDYDADSNDYGYDTYRDAWNGGVMDGAALLRRLADETTDTETEADTSELLGLIRDFLDPDPCSFDHHGYCQAHGYLGGEPMSCPHGRAKKLLAELDQPAVGARQDEAQR